MTIKIKRSVADADRTESHQTKSQGLKLIFQEYEYGKSKMTRYQTKVNSKGYP